MGGVELWICCFNKVWARENPDRLKSILAYTDKELPFHTNAENEPTSTTHENRHCRRQKHLTTDTSQFTLTCKNK